MRKFSKQNQEHSPMEEQKGTDVLLNEVESITSNVLKIKHATAVHSDQLEEHSEQLEEHHDRLAALHVDLTQLQARFVISTNTEWTRFSYIPNQNFQRRNRLWQALEQRFSEEHPTFPVVLSGQGGMGKSSLASQWAHKQEVHEQYQAVRYMLMDKANIMNSLHDLAVDLHIMIYEYDAVTQEKKPRAIEAWLRDISQVIKKQSWFMVWDNVENYAAIEPLLPYFIHTNSLHQHLLITSRDATSWARPIYVDTYTREESLHYIENQMTQVALTNFNEQDASDLAARLEDNPLALELAMGAICLHRYTLHRYFQQLETASISTLHVTPKKAYQARINLNTITTLWHMASEHLTSDAIKLLRLMSFINAEGVQRALLVNFLDNDESRCDAALLALRAQSFIQPQAHPSLEKWRMHRLLQDVVRADFLYLDELNNEIILDFLHQGALALKNTFFIEELQMNDEGVREGITHGTIWSHYENEFVINIDPGVSQSAARVVCEMSLILWKKKIKSMCIKGIATQAHMLFEPLFKKREELSLTIEQQLMSADALLASSNDLLASFPGGFKKQPVAQDSIKSASVVNLESRSAIDATALGEQSLAVQNYVNARDCFTQALTVYRAIHGQEAKHPDIATALKNLGKVYQAVKQPIYASDYLTQALVMYRHLYGQKANHHDIAESLILLGAACESNSLFQAREYYTEALAMLTALECAKDHSLVVAAQKHLDSTTQLLCCVACCCPCVCTGTALYVLINTLFRCCSGAVKPASSEAATVSESHNPLTKKAMDSSETASQVLRSSELTAPPKKQSPMDRLSNNQTLPVKKIHTLFREGYTFSTRTTRGSDQHDELSIQVASSIADANSHTVELLAEVEQEYLQMITDFPSQAVVEKQGQHRWIIRSSPFFIENMNQELRSVVTQYAQNDEEMEKAPCTIS